MVLNKYTRVLTKNPRLSTFNVFPSNRESTIYDFFFQYTTIWNFYEALLQVNIIAT